MKNNDTISLVVIFSFPGRIVDDVFMFYTMTEIPNTDHFLFELPKYRPKIGKYRVPPYRTPPQLQRFYDEENCSSVLQCAIENKVKHDESLRLIIMERYHYTSNRIISTKTID